MTFSTKLGVGCMDTRKIASEYRLAQWAQAVQERVANGETVKDFCQNRGISKNTYFYWQQKLRLTAAEQLASPQALTPAGWTKAELEKADSRSLSIEINGCHVMVDENTDSELLSKVCRALMSLC